MEERDGRGDVINKEILFFPCTRHQCILGTVSSILGVDVILFFFLVTLFHATPKRTGL